MNIHFVDDHVYCKAYVEYVNSRFNPSDNIFVLCGSNPRVLQSEENLIILNKKRIQFLKSVKALLNKYPDAKIFFHYFSYVKIIISFITNRKQKKYWLFWGGDFYTQVNYPMYDKKTAKIIVEKKQFSLRSLITRYLFRLSLKYKMDYIAVSAAEFKIIKSYLKTSAKQIDFIFPNPVGKIPEFKPHTDNRKLKILLGNSADPSNNHISIIDLLHGLDLDYEVIVPLSYSGSEEYKNYVLSYGKQLLGERFVPLTKFLSQDEYLDLLLQVDVAIMNHYRQQAVGNIRILLAAGKKVYLNDVNPVYVFFEDMGVHLERIDENILGSLMIPLNYEVALNNRNLVTSFYSDEQIVKYMKNLLC